MVKFLPLGGAEEIGASCYYLNIDGTGILLDCGVDPQKKGMDALPDFSALNDIELDYVVVSHAHQDHIGALPFLVKSFPHVRIIATPQTIEVARLTLHNAVNILGSDLDFSLSMPIYTHEEVDFLLRSIVELAYEDEYLIEGIRHSSSTPIKLKLFDAGHIIGSASILLEYKNERIFYTGDIKFSPQTLMAGATLPKQRVTTLLTETTYGSTDSEKVSNLENEISRFVTESNKIISSGGSILIPVFALGKMQEIISIIANEIDKGRLTDVPVYTGGIGNKISRVYDLNRFKVSYMDSGFELGKVETHNYFEINDLSVFNKNPSFVIASSGMMLPGTSSFRFAKYWLKQKSFAIFAVGYMDPDSPGYKIVDSADSGIAEFTEDEKMAVNCKINRFFFPTHSSREEILEIAINLNPANIVLIHGEEDSKNWVGSRLLELLPQTKVYSATTLNWINHL